MAEFIKNCQFCNTTTEIQDDEVKVKKVSERFRTVLQKFMVDNRKGNWCRAKNSLEWFGKLGFNCVCTSCYATIETICDLYQELKKAEQFLETEVEALVSKIDSHKKSGSANKLSLTPTVQLRKLEKFNSKSDEFSIDLQDENGQILCLAVDRPLEPFISQNQDPALEQPSSSTSLKAKAVVEQVDIASNFENCQREPPAEINNFLIVTYDSRIPTIFHCEDCDTDFLTRKELDSHFERCDKQPEVQATLFNSADSETTCTSDEDDEEGNGDSDFFAKYQTDNSKPDPGTKQRFPCQICGLAYSTTHNLHRHTSRKHCATIAHCSRCPKTFSGPQNLKKHIWVAHTDKEKWVSKCDTCEKRFPFKFQLDKHNSRRHGNQEGLQLKSTLNPEHLIGSSKTKNKFQCKNCPKTFPEKYKLNRHMLATHTSKSSWRFKCNVCKRKFAHAEYLTKHQKIHAIQLSGEKPFACRICDAKFGSYSSVYKHMKTRH